MERKDLIRLLNTKKIYSRFSGKIITFIEEMYTKRHYLVDEVANDKEGVYSDGMFLIDNIENVEDDIQQMYCIMEDGSYYNMEDFYSDFGAFEDGDKFYNNIKKLIADR